MTRIRRPDLVLIMTDQQRYDQVGYAGSTPVRTPNLDRLAASGVIFDTTYSGSTTCVPARTSLVTGLLDHRARYREPFGSRPRLLHRASRPASRGLSDGIDRQDALQAHAIGPRLRAHAGRRAPERLRRSADDAAGARPLSRLAGVTGAGRLAPRRPGASPAGTRSIRRPTRRAGWSGKPRRSFRDRDDDRPLFLVVSFPHPHPPINPPEPYASLYDPDERASIDPDWHTANAYLPASFRRATAEADAPASAGPERTAWPSTAGRAGSDLRSDHPDRRGSGPSSSADLDLDSTNAVLHLRSWRLRRPPRALAKDPMDPLRRSRPRPVVRHLELEL